MVVVEDNGPGIVKAQAPKIFGKLLYGSKFHRLKQSRGQQGIGISAAAMYGQLTTGQPIRVTSRIGKGKPAHYFEIQIDTRKNNPVVTEDRELDDWHQEHGTRVELEIVANWQQGQRFVNRYVEHTALSNPHATFHYLRPRQARLTFPRATEELPKEALEIKPHPHGVELGALMLMAAESKSHDVKGFLQTAFSRVSDRWPPRSSRTPASRSGSGPRNLAEDRELAETAPPGDRRDQDHGPAHELLSPIGDELMRRGLVSFLNVIETEGPEDGRAARPRPGREEEGLEEGEGGQGRRARRARRAARGGRREDQGAQLLHRHRHPAAQGLPRQPVPGGGGPGLRRLLAGRQAHRAVPLRQPRAAPLPAQRLRDDRGHRQDRLAQLPALPAEGLAPGRPHGAARPHRLGLGAVHQRGQGGGGPLPGDHPGDPAGGAGVRPQARHPHPQEEARRLPGAAPQHLRALHPGGGPGIGKITGKSPEPSSASSCGSPTR